MYAWLDICHLISTRSRAGCKILMLIFCSQTVFNSNLMWINSACLSCIHIHFACKIFSYRVHMHTPQIVLVWLNAVVHMGYVMSI